MKVVVLTHTPNLITIIIEACETCYNKFVPINRVDYLTNSQQSQRYVANQGNTISKVQVFSRK